MQDRDTQRVHRLYFTKAQLISPDQAYAKAGTVNSSGELRMVIESVRPDAGHSRYSNLPFPADGAGGCCIG
jgi:hypothetical protein